MNLLTMAWHWTVEAANWLSTAADSVLKYLPFVTAVALVFAVYQYVQITRKNRIAIVNALFETLKHNLNIRRGSFFQDSPDTNRQLGTMLKQLGDQDVYPNPTDSADTLRRLYDAVNYVENDQLPYANEYMPLLYGSIKSIFENGYYHRLLKRRIVLNLGHLNYGLERNNIRLKSFNQLLARYAIAQTVASSGFKSDYMMWVHFRQCFLMLDLVRSYRKGWFSDIKEYERLKKAVG